MNSKNKSFLEKFHVKESGNLIGLDNFGAIEFLIMGGLRWYFTKSPTVRVPQPNFYILP